MTWLTEIQSAVLAAGFVLAALVAILVLETVLPHFPRKGAWRSDHRVPNLMFTAVTLVLNLVGSAGLVVLLARQEALGLGLRHAFPAFAVAELVVSLVVLDLSFYAAHVSMHKLPAFWRFHRVHHADPQVDATTTLRQHPGETVIRFAFTAFFATLLGASPAAYATYRGAVAIGALLEHADVRVPRWLDETLAVVTTWPGFHKIHHSRDPRLTDSNYGNLLSVWDRLFGTRTRAPLGQPIEYGLAGLDDRRTQSISGLWSLPFRSGSQTPSSADLETERGALPMR